MDLRFSVKSLETTTANSDYVSALQDAMLEKFKETKGKLIASYQRYRKYYDQKASAQPLKLHDYCLLFNPKLTTQSDFASKSVQIWLPLYRVEKVLTNSNYIIRKTGTNFTQCVHRIRLRSIKPNEKPDDLEQIDQQKFETDPSLTKYRSEPAMFDDHLQTLIDDIQLTYHQEKIEPAPAKVSLAIPIGPAPPMPIAPAPPAAIPPAPVIMPPVAAPAIASPLLPHGNKNQQN